MGQHVRPRAAHQADRSKPGAYFGTADSISKSDTPYAHDFFVMRLGENTGPTDGYATLANATRAFADSTEKGNLTAVAIRQNDAGRLYGQQVVDRHYDSYENLKADPQAAWQLLDLSNAGVFVIVDGKYTSLTVPPAK